jgi:SSS family solute:Na+ symporter
MLSSIDYGVTVFYAVALILIAWRVSRKSSGGELNSNDYFLAGQNLPWWAIGASLIAANISAEQIIGMSGSGYVLGLAIASYEWMAAITLILVGWLLLPIFLEKKIYTMPQFLKLRFDNRVKFVMAIFWLLVYVFVNLTSILWLGALSINSLTSFDLFYSLVFLAAFAATYSLYGGLKAVALTDIIQVVMLVGGGLLISYLTLDKISGGLGAIAGFERLYVELPDKFDMIFTPDQPYYKDLPGLHVLLGGMWIMNVSYWGFNQYIIQRALGAKSLAEARKGIAFAAFLKLLMPFIIVVPGIAAIMLAPDLAKPDQAYSEMMKLTPTGVRGLIFAALIAAIISSIGSMVNSISTIFTLDIVKSYKPDTSEHDLVRIGRIVGFIALTIAVFSARPLLGNMEQAFQYIQEFTGFFTPGVVSIFILGMFWRPTTSNGALMAAIGSFALSLAFKLYMPDMPFMIRVGWVFVLCTLAAMAVSAIWPNSGKGEDINISDISFSTDTAYKVAALMTTLMLVALYTIFW